VTSLTFIRLGQGLGLLQMGIVPDMRLLME
ncbi:unnamed protein product, partial [marine sediment metagenome]